MAPVSVNNQFPHVGLAAYFERAVWRDAARAERIAALLVDPRWPWIPWWASYSGLHKRDDRSSVRVGGKNGVTPLVRGFASDKVSALRMNRARGDSNFTSLMLDLDRTIEEWDPFRLLITCRSAELPAGKSFEDWVALAHELITAVGALHATIGAWPTFDMAIGDTWLTRIILDTPKRDINLGLPPDFDEQMSLMSKWKHKLGRVYARHPRWGTYLHAGHVAAIGGVERIRAEVAPARVDAVGELTYIQLTATIDTALTSEAGVKRRALQTLMAPILLGAPLPPGAA